MFRVLSVVLLVMLTGAVWAQRGQVKGGVYAAGTREPVTGATVQLLTKDSVVRGMLLTDSTGHFQFSNLAPGSYRLTIQVMSYQEYTRNLVVKNNAPKTGDSIFLQPGYESLGAVTIVARRPKVVVKTDTTEFSASAVKVKKNGTVEDVFKKLPGVEVDKDGGIKAQGEAITQIYVDGKPFFGGDLKAVTQNFPADIIEKIQIIDKKSDQALATHVEDGQREKIINITLKKNRKRGLFGTDYIGYGTDKRYEGRSNTNFFNNDKKVSIVAAANNTGRVDNGTGTDDQSYYNTWNGITDIRQLKLNYANKIGQNFTFNTYAGYDYNRSKRMQSINRQNIFTDSTTNYLEDNNSTTINQNTYAGLYFEWKPDTLTFIRFNQNAAYGTSDYNFSSVFNSALPTKVQLNNGDRTNSNKSNTPNFNGQFSINRRFRESRRNIFFSFNNNINNTNSKTFNVSNNYYFPVNDSNYQQLLNQYGKITNRGTNLGTSVSYTEPLGKNSSLNFSYNLNYGASNVLKRTLDFNDTSLVYDIPNDTLSNHFDNRNYNHTAGVTYNYGNTKNGFGVGVRWQDALTMSKSLDSSNKYQQKFDGFAPAVNYWYSTKSTKFNIYYNFSLRAPQSGQLQPVVDNTNPLFIKTGNPDLKYSEIHTVKYYFNYYNAKKETGFNSNAQFSQVVDNIVNSNDFDNNTGVQISKPVNMDGAYNWNAWFSYFRPLKLGTDKLKWNVSLYANGNKTTSLLNSAENINQSTYAKLNTGFIYDTPEWIDLNANFAFSRQEGQYSLQPGLNNVSYFWSVNPNIRLNPTPTTEVTIDYDFRQTTGQSAGYNTSINMLNADVVQYFSKKRDIWLKLKGYDLLKQNVNIWRSTGDNYIQDTRANVLSRFLLLSLNIRLNKFTPPAENKGNEEGQGPVTL
ncbi:TonB-dependent receptor [Deminuibacter soli]|nr:TonB-dependent receptor [Deminuibacter soli]